MALVGLRQALQRQRFLFTMCVCVLGGGFARHVTAVHLALLLGGSPGVGMRDKAACPKFDENGCVMSMTYSRVLHSCTMTRVQRLN